VSGFIQPTAVFPVNNFDRVARKEQCLSLYVYIRSCLDAKHRSFQLGFYNNSYFTNAEELIHRLNPNLENQCAFSLVLHL